MEENTAETIDETGTAVGTHATEATNDSETTVEIAFHELGDTARHLSERGEGLEEAADHLGALTRMAQAIDPNEAMSVPAAEALEISVKRMIQRIGGSVHQISVENHTGLSRHQSRIALETFSATVRKVWMRLVDAFKSAWSWFKQFLDKTFGAAQQLERRCAKMEETLKRCVDYPVSDMPSITNEPLRRFFGGAGKYSSDKIVTNYAKQVSTLIEIQRGSTAYMVNAENALKVLLDNYNKYANDDPEAALVKFQAVFEEEVTPIFYDATKFYKSIPNYSTKSGNDTSNDAKPGTELFTISFDFGHSHFYGRTIKEGIDQAERIKAMRHCGYGVSPDSHSGMASEIEPLSLGDCKKVVYLVKNRVKDIAQARQEVAAMSDAFNALIKTTHQSGVTGGHEPMKPIIMNAITSSASLLMRMATTGERTIRVFELQCAKKMLDYVGTSMKNLVPKSGNV